MSRYIDADLTDPEILNAVQEETADADTFITVRRILNKLPTANVSPVVHAHWEKVADHVFRCSLCNNHRRYASNYCPNCGAKMDEDMKGKQDE